MHNKTITYTATGRIIYYASGVMLTSGHLINSVHDLHASNHLAYKEKSNMD